MQILFNNIIPGVAQIFMILLYIMNITRPNLETAIKILSDAYASELIPFDSKNVEPYCDGGGALTLKCIDTHGTEYAVRFPNTEQKLNNMLHEIETLRFLRAQHLPEQSGLEIPEPHYVDNAKHPFVWHKAIVGETLTPSQYHTLTDNQKTNIAKKIAKFLHAMHTCKPLNTSNKTDSISFFIADAQLNGFDVLRAKIPVAILNTYKALKLNGEYPKVFCHFDMHGRNMAINPETKDIIGIFDFGDAGMHLCFLDFYKLSFIHRDLTRRTINEYNKISDVKIDINDVDLAYLCDMAAKYANTPQDGIVNKSLENFVQDITSVQQLNMVKTHEI